MKERRLQDKSARFELRFPEGFKDEECQKELLKYIGHKEKELKRLLDEAHQQGQKKIEKARESAEHLIARAKTDIPSDMEEYLRKGLEEVDREVEDILSRSDVKVIAIRTTAEKRIDQAAGLILSRVFPTAKDMRGEARVI